MGCDCCCMSASTVDKSNEALVSFKPKEGKKYQLLCLKGHEIIFYTQVKAHLDTTEDESPIRAQ